MGTDGVDSHVRTGSGASGWLGVVHIFVPGRRRLVTHDPGRRELSVEDRAVEVTPSGGVRSVRSLPPSARHVSLPAVKNGPAPGGSLLGVVLLTYYARMIHELPTTEETT